MKIKEGFLLRQIADSWMAVPVGMRTAEVNGLISLNETAAAIWEIFQEDHTEEEAVERLSETYEVSKDELAISVHDFVQMLREKGILE